MLHRAGRGAAWGIFLTAYAEIEQVRRHFRRLLRVRTEGGETLLFRFYDPRVLRQYLPTCISSELQEMYGPVEQYLYEGEERGTMVVARRRDTGIGDTGLEREVFARR